MTIRGVIFDLGGTLCARQTASHEELNAEALGRWLRTRGIKVDDAFVPALTGERERLFDAHAGSNREAPAAEALRPILQRYGAPDDPRFFADAEAAFFVPELEAMRSLPEAVELLRRLHDRGIVIGLASNASSHYFVVECCRRLNFAAYLDPIVSSAAVGWTKPDPRIFQTVLARWSLPAAAVVMVGDNLEADIVGAQRVGMRTVLLTAEHHVPDIYRRQPPSGGDIHADAVAISLAEVGRLIERWR